MTALAAEAVGCRAEEFLVCSTGVIGRHLPMPAVESGIRAAVGRLDASVQSFEHAARAILTTDTRIKVSTRAITVQGTEYHVTGFAKGAAMIGPNLATMLAFVLTDAPVAPKDLQVPGASSRRAVVQLHQRRRTYEHQRFTSVFRQRHRRKAGT